MCYWGWLQFGLASWAGLAKIIVILFLADDNYVSGIANAARSVTMPAISSSDEEAEVHEPKISASDKEAEFHEVVDRFYNSKNRQSFQLSLQCYSSDC